MKALCLSLIFLALSSSCCGQAVAPIQLKCHKMDNPGSVLAPDETLMHGMACRQIKQPKPTTQAVQATAHAGQDRYAPLPEKVVNSKTVFFINDTTSSRFGDDLYQELKKWNRWQVVTDKKKADLILVLSQRDHIEGAIATATATTSGNTAYATGSSVPVKSSSWHILLIDPTNGQTVWVSSHTMGGRLWQSWGSVARSLLLDIQKRLK